MIVRALGLLAVVPFLIGAASQSGPTGRHAVTIQDRQITEASALVALPGGLFATSNDSGDTGRVFVLDRTGATVGVTHWSADPTDVEALAPAGDGQVWVGDIGDNAASRTTIQVAEVPVGRGERTVTPPIYSLAYPDGAHDAETLLCDPADGRLYVATKGILGGTLYAAPAHLVAGATNRLTAVGRVLPIATDGTFWPDGRFVLIRNYFAATVYAWPSLEPQATFQLPNQPQGEGIGVTAGGRVYLSSEGLHSTVIADPLPADVEKVLVPAEKALPPGPRQLSAGTTAHSARTTTDSTGGGWWPWALGGLAGLAVIGVLLLALRPTGRA